MIDRVAELEEAVERHLRCNQTWMVGGFGRGGVPFSVLEHIADRSDEFRNLVLIKNDANEPGLGIAPLLAQGQARKLVATHLGLNPDFIAQMNLGAVDCEIVPQGIFAERIRAGGAGIPAFLSDIGEGTELAAGQATVEVDGRAYLLERALRGDVALVCADIVDRSGNAWWRGTNRNMSVVMAMACQCVIVEAQQIVDVGSLVPEDVQLPGVLVDAVVQARPRRHHRATGSG